VVPSGNDGTMEKYLLVVTVVSAVTWGAMELTLIWRDEARGMGRTYRDQDTRTLIVASVLAAAVIAGYLARAAVPHPSLAVPGQPWTILAGLCLVAAGAAIRSLAVAELGDSFRTTVEVDDGQAVVSTGPYRLIRHPSYTGLLLIAAGFGLASHTWPGLVVCVLFPLSAMLARIHVEESELVDVIGDPYRAYRTRTKRLIPGLW
jgi:protein-S-isoprenylcysteine O-methyltransferase Ste14